MHHLRGCAMQQSTQLMSKRAATDCAISLGQAVRTSRTVQTLDLRESPDLLCVNLMCEKVGDPCICRLSAVLERLPQLKHLNLSHNQLTSIPDSIGRLTELHSLDLSHNNLSNLPESLKDLSQLKVLAAKTLQAECWRSLTPVLVYRGWT